MCFFLISFAHDLGDRIKDLVMASAASGGAVCHLLDLLESLLYISEIIVGMKNILDIEI